MWNNHGRAFESDLRRGQSRVPESTTAENARQNAVPREDERVLSSENLANAAPQQDIALAYAALLDDNEAFRTRLEREKTRVIDAEKASLAQALLDSTDDLERALIAADVGVAGDQGLLDLTQGVRLSLALLYKRIADMGAERMSTTGQRFDPVFAEAVGTVSVTDPAQHGIIVQEIRPGYRVGDRLLRPAQVRVGAYLRRPL